MKRTILLHNTAINYRLPLFRELRRKLDGEIEFWFYSEPNQPISAKYFHFFKFKIRFSVSVIIHLLFAKKPDSIILFGSSSYELPFLFLITQLKRIPIIFWTETWNWGTFGLKERVFYEIIKIIARNSDLVLYPGKKVMELYTQLGISEQKMIFAPDASINDDPIDKEYIQKGIAPTPGKTTIVYLARILKRKGLIYLLNALDQLSSNEYELIIGGGHGEPDYETTCMKQIQKMPNIKYFGRIPKEKVNSFLSIGNIFVYPSINPGNMGEPWGLILNEAVNLGIPVIGTDIVAASHDLIREGENGFIVKEKSTKELKEAILKTKNLDPTKVKAVSLEIMRLYSYENMAQGFITAINQISHQNE